MITREKQNKIEYILLLFLITMITPSLNAQDGGDSYLHSNVIGPSPTVAALEKFTEIPVGHYTGTPTVNVPIWNVQGRSLSVPISLSYHGSGVKVDDLPGWVGSNWALNAGGVISRTMRGKPDELSGVGYLDLNHEFPDPTEDPYVLETFIDASLEDWVENATNGVTDLEPDIFTFNFGGMSGKFVFGEDDEIYTIPYQPLDIERTLLDGNTRWEIKTESGMTYVFGTRDDGHVAIEQTFVESIFDGNENIMPAYESSWYLVEIIAPFETDRIKFTYAPNNILYDVEKTERKYVAFATGNLEECIGTHTKYGAVSVSVSSKRLSQIETSKTIVNFNIHEGREDTKGGSGCYLTSVEVLEKESEELIRQFDLSYSYFESTGGVCGGESAYLCKRLRLDSVTESFDLCNRKPPYVFVYDENESLPPRFSFAQDHWGYYNGHNENTSLVPSTVVGDDLILVNGANRDPDVTPEQNYLKAGSLIEVIYPTGGSGNYTYESHDYTYADSEIEIRKVNYTENSTGTDCNIAFIEIGTFTIPNSQNVHFYSKVMPMVGFDAEAEIIIKNSDDEIVPYGEFICSETYDHYTIPLDAGTYSIQTLSNHEDAVINLKTVWTAMEEVLPAEIIEHTNTVSRDFCTECPFAETESFTIDHTQFIDLYITVNNDDLPECNSEIKIKDAYGVTVPFGGFSCNSSGDHRIILEEGTYTISAETYTPGDHAAVRMDWKSLGEPAYVSKAGGLRIKATALYDGVSHDNDIIRKYEYRLQEEPERSSGFLNDQKLPIYTTVNLREVLTPVITGTLTTLCAYSETSSNAFSAGNYLGGGNVGYAEVVEIHGVDGENGKIIYNYTTSREFPDIGEQSFPFAPLISNDWKRGLPLKTSVYNSEDFLLSETINEFEYFETTDDPYFKIIPALKTAYAINPVSFDLSWENFKKVAVFLPYQIVVNRLQQIETTKNIYNTYNDEVITSKSNYYYESDNHIRLTKSVSTESNGRKIIEKIKYIDDYPLGTSNDFSISISNLKTDHKIQNIPVLTEVWLQKEGEAEKLLSANFTAFKEQPSTLILPYQIYSLETLTPISAEDYSGTMINETGEFIYDPNFELKVTYDHFDARGNILQATPKDGLPIVFKWAYDSSLPVAKISNAETNNGNLNISAGYTGFESGSEELNNSNEDYWQFDATNEHSFDAHTGKYSRKIGSGTETDRWFLPSDQLNTYLFSCWVKTEDGFGDDMGVLHINTTTNDGESIIVYPVISEASQELSFGHTGGNWKLVEVEFDLNEIRDLSGLGEDAEDLGIYLEIRNNDPSHYLLVDDVRFHTQDAWMETYTYNQKSGMSSAQGVTSIPTYFEYDPLGRLELIKDRQENIVELYRYNYANYHKNTDYSYAPTPVYVAEPVAFTGLMDCMAEGDATYTWSFGDDIIITVSDPYINHTYNSEGTFTANLTAVDSEGYTGVVSKEIPVTYRPLIVNFGLSYTGMGDVSPDLITFEVPTGTNVNFLADIISSYPDYEFSWKLDDGAWIAEPDSETSHYFINESAVPMVAHHMYLKVVDEFSGQIAEFHYIIWVHNEDGPE